MAASPERIGFATRSGISSPRLFALFLVFLLPIAAWAAAPTKVWDNGAADNMWNTANNWNPDGVPASTDSVIFNSGSANCYFDKLTTTIQSIQFTSGYTGRFEWGYAGYGKGLRGMYWSDTGTTTYSGSTYSRVDANINFPSDWGTTTPSGIGGDTYKVTWHGHILPQYSETYTFYDNSDDGFKLWVNNTLVIDKWLAEGTVEYTGTIALTAGVLYDFKAEYFEQTSTGQAILYWSSASRGKEVIPQNRLFPDRNGLEVTWFDNDDFTGASGTVVSSFINYNWGGGGTDEFWTGDDNWSARWTGYIEPQYSEDYTFYGNRDDRIYVWIDDQQIITTTTCCGEVTSSAVRLEAGVKYAVKVEFKEFGGSADAKLSWESASQSKEVVPNNRLWVDYSMHVTKLADFRSGGVINFNAGNLIMEGTSAQTLIPNSTYNLPRVVQNGSGGTTVTTNNLTCGLLQIVSGTFNLGTGRTITPSYLRIDGGTINFGTSNLVLAQKNVDFSSLGSATSGANGSRISFSGTASPTTIAGTITGTDVDIDFNGSATYTVTAALNVGTGLVTKGGSGAITLSGNSTWSGGYTHSGTQITYVNHNNALGSGTATFSGASGQFKLADAVNVPVALTVNTCAPGSGNGIVEGPTTSGSATWSGAITINSTCSNGGHFAGGNATGTLTLSGGITSPSVVPLMRADKIVLSGGGNYTDLAITQATVYLGATNGINTGSSVTLGASGTAALDLNGFSQTVTQVIRASNTPTVTNSSGTAGTLTINYSGAGDSTSTVFTGNMAVTKTGSGTFKFRGANTYSGATTVSGGALDITSIGSCIGTDSWIITSGASTTVNGTLTLASTTTSVFGIGYGVASGTSTFTINTGAAVTVAGGGGRTFVGGGPSGGPYGTGVLTMAGGTFTVGAVGTFPNDDFYLAGYGGTGTFNLNGGTFIIAREVSRGAGPSYFYFNGGTFRATATLWHLNSVNTVEVRNGAANFDPNGYTLGINNDIDHSSQGGDNATDGGVHVTGSTGTVWLNVTGSSWTGATTVASGTTLGLTAADVIPDNIAVTVSGTLDMRGQSETIGSLAGGGTVDNSTGAGTYTLTTGGNDGGTTFSGILKNTSGNLAIVKEGSGVWIVQGNNTYTGGTTINEWDMRCDHNNCYGTGTVTVNAGGLAQLWSPSGLTIPNNWVLNGSSGNSSYPTLTHDGGAGAVVLNGNISVTAASEIGMGGTTSNNMTINGVISGSGNLSIDEANGGSNNTLILAGANTFTGTLYHTTGTLRLGAAAVIPDGCAVTLNGGTIDLYGQSETIGSLAGSGTVTNSTGAGTYTLTAGGDNTSTTTTTVIQNPSGTVAITKAGTGTWTISGNSTYTGATSVNAGILKLGHASAALGTSAGGVTVATGAGLDLNGQTYSTTETSTTITGTGVSSGGAIFNSSATGATWPGLLTLGGAASIIAGTGTIAISNAGTIAGSGHYLTLGGAQNGTLTSIVGTGSGKIYKQDAGTWTLNGASTYTGGSEISGGTLSINAENRLGAPSGATLLTFAGNSTLAVTTGFTTTKEFYLNTGITGTFDIAASQTLTANGDIRSINTAPIYKAGTGTLILGADNDQMDNDIYVTAGTLDCRHQNCAGNSAGSDYIYADAGTTVRITLDAATDLNCSFQANGTGVNLVSDRATSGAGVTHTFYNSAVNGAYTLNVTAGSNVASGTQGLGIRNTTTLAGNSVFDVADPGTPDLLMTLTGVVSGAFSLTKQGTATLTLAGDNTYSGATSVTAGTLIVQGEYATPSYAISSGAVVELNRASDINYATSTSFTGAGTLRKTGAGQVVWTGAVATFGFSSGALIDVQTGNFVGGSGGNEVWTSNLSDLTVASGAVFFGVEANVIVDALNGAGNLRSGYTGAGYVNFTFGADNGTGDFTGVIQDNNSAGAFVKAGTGTQTLSGTNTYTGTTTVNAGTLKLNNTAALGTTAAGTTVASGAALDLNGITYSSAEALTISGHGISSGGALLNSNATAATFGGIVTLGAAAGISAGTGNITLSNTGNTISGTTQTLSLWGAANGTIAGAIALGNADLNKSGAGTWTLQGTSTRSGQTNDSGGTIVVNQTNSLGTGTTYINGSTLSVLINGAGSNGTITMANKMGINSSYNGTLNVGHLTANTGNTVLFPYMNHGSGNSTINFTGSDGYLVEFTNYRLLGGGGGTSIINPTTTSIIMDKLDGGAGTAHTAQLDGTSTGNRILLANDSTTALTVTKTNTSTWTLSGLNTYSGTTTISGGTLVVQSPGYINSASAVTVSSGGTLAGTGSVNGTLTVANGGIVSPGIASEATLSAGATVLNSTSVLTYALGTVNTDKLAVTGNFTLDGTVNVAAGTGFTAGTYTLATYTGTLTNNTLNVGTMPTGYYGTITAGSNVVTLSIADYSGFNYVSTVYFNTTATGANVPGNVTNFPMLVRLDSNNFYFDQAQPDGRDIRFSDPNGTALQYEIERWNTTLKRAEIWVLVPQVDGNSDRDFMNMYWGNPNATAETAANRVFETANNFAAVWHLGEEGNNNASNYRDATANANHGTGTSMSASSDVAGAIGLAQDFDGAADYVSVGTSTTLRPANYMTLSAWVYPRTTGGNESYYTNHQDNGCTESGFYPAWGPNTPKYFFSVRTASMACNNWWDNAPGLGGSAGRWNHLVGTYDGAKIRTYLNGVPYDSLAATGAIQWGTAPADSRIGMYYDDNENWYHDGYVDELSLSGVARSADWIKLSYETQRPNPSAVNYPNAQLSTWSNNTRVYVNTSASGAATTTEVANFPMLVRLNSGNFSFAQARSDGADLRFSDSTGALLSYEIERYDATNKVAEIWVLLPNVKANNNTQWFRMYWGKPASTSLSSGIAVFQAGNGWLGAWHLNTSGTGTRPNSAPSQAALTATSYDGDEYTTANGYIAGADDLDGTNDHLNAGAGYADFTTGMTASMWANPATNGNWARFMDFGSGAGTDNLILAREGGTNNLNFEIYNNTTSGGSASGSAVITQTAWQKVAVTVDASSNVKVYRNGLMVASRTSTQAIRNQSRSNNWFGRSNWGGDAYFQGKLDEIQLSNVARSPDWMRLEYESQRVGGNTVWVGARQADYAASARFNFNTTASGANVSGNVANIPILVKLTSANFDFSRTRDDAADLQFVDKDGTFLYHEVVEWDKGNSLGKAWVKVPQVDGNSNADFITLYYGCPACASAPYAAADSVWGGYNGVWHLAGNTTLPVDATRYNVTGTFASDQASSPGQTSSLTKYFDGTNDAVQVANPGDNHLDFGTGDFSISAWVKTTNTGAASYWPEILVKDNGGGTRAGYSLNFLTSSNPGQVQFEIWSNNVQATKYSTSTTLNDGNWHLLTGKKTSTAVELFVDGASNGTTAHTLGSTTVTTDLGIGKRFANQGYNFKGNIQEAQILPTALSADHIKLSYENQKSSSALFSAAAITTASFQKSRVFNFNTTASGANIPGDVLNFPLLIRLAGNVPGTATPYTDITQSAGQDIRFLDGDGVTWLDYQIERWSTSLDSAEVWVKVPRIRGNSSNGFITMYFQQASGLTLADGQCAACVFGSSNGFGGTYHLATDVTDAGGTYNGTDNSTGDVGGNIGRGRSFNGTTGYVSITRPIQDDFTIGFWMNTTTAGVNLGSQWHQHTPLVDAEVGGSTNDFGVCLQDKVPTFGTGNGDVTIAASSPDTVQTGTWKYITATRTRAGVTTLSVNGTRKISGTGNYNSMTAPGSINFGRIQAGGRFYTGNLDEIQLSTVARDTSWILLTYQTQRRDAALLFNPSPADFQKTNKFTFNTTRTGANVMDSVTNFPVLVRVNGSVGGTPITDLVQGTGTNAPPDIRFLDGDGKTWLNYQVERWDRGASVDSGEVWVMVPQVNGNSDHDFITMYYQQASGVTVPANECAACVFSPSNGFAAVYHLNSEFADHTGNGNTGTNNGTTASAVAVIAGGQDFNGSTQYVTAANSSSLNVTPAIGMSAWIHSDSWAGGNRRIMQKGTSNNDDQYIMKDESDLLQNFTKNNVDNYHTAPLPSTGAWHHVYGTYDGATRRIYVDGTETASETAAGTLVTTSGAFDIGRKPGTASAGDYFDGTIDEVRVESSARSADWVKLTYESQRRAGNVFWNARTSPNNLAVLTATAGNRNIALTWTGTVSDSSNADSVRIYVDYTGYPDSVGAAGQTKVVTLPKTDSSYNYPAVAAGLYYFGLAVRNSSGAWSPITKSSSDTANLQGYSYYPDTVYVDSAIGSDANSCAQAASPLTPKLSVAGASGAQTCDPNASDSLFIRVMPGTYSGADNWHFVHASKPVIVASFDNKSRAVFNSAVGSGVWNSTEFLPTIYMEGDVYARNLDVKAGQAGGSGIMTAQAPQNPNAIEGCRIFNNGATTNYYGIVITNNTHDYQHFSNNLIYQPTNVGIYVRLNSRCNIVNNVVIGTGAGTTYGILNNTAAGSATSNFANNILYNWDYGIWTTSSTAAIGTVSNNLCFRVTSGREITGSTDANMIIKDPLFVESANPWDLNAFKVLPGSPAIDAGTSTFTSGFSRTTPVDMFGSPRPTGIARDIGLYEGTGHTSTPASEFDSLITSTTSTTVTVKNAKWKLTWDVARGAGINFFSDMADSTTNLLAASSLLFDAKVGSYQASSQTSTGPQLNFAERTRARAVVRQWLPVSATLNLIILYTIHPSGHIFISSELENLGGSAATLTSFDYTLKLGTTTTAATASGGTRNGFGYLNTATRDALLSVTQDLDKGADSAETWTSTAAAGPPGTIVFATANASPSVKWRKRSHTFLLYIGDQALNRQKAATLNAEAINPTPLTVTSGTVTMERSWQDGLAGHWTLDDGGGGKARDKAVINQNDATITASDTIWTSGKVGGALYLNNTDVAVVTDNDNLEAVLPSTFMFWIKPDFAGMGTTAFIISKGITTSDGWYFRKASGQSQITFNMGAASATTPTLTDGVWTHITAVVKTGTKQVDLYVNGAMVANSSVAATAVANATNLRFGENAAGGAADRFKGTLDDIRIYRNEIYNHDIQAIYNRGYSPKYGHYAVRADNNNRVVAVLNDTGTGVRVQPSFQIGNWYGPKTPKFVYLNGVRLKPNTDFIVDSIHTFILSPYLVLQLNKTLTGTAQTLFIDDDDSTGYMGASSAMKALTISATANDKIVIKNFADTVFGSATSRQWYLELDLNGWTNSANNRATDTGFGEFNNWRAAAINPNVAINSATQLVGKHGQGGQSLLSMKFRTATSNLYSGGLGYGSPGNIAYTVVDSSATRLSLILSAMAITGSGANVSLTKRWTVYPTGRIFGSFEITTTDFSMDNPEVRIMARYNGDLPVNAWSTGTAQSTGRWGAMGGDLSFHSVAGAVLSIKSAGATTTDAATNITGTSTSSGNSGGEDKNIRHFGLATTLFQSTDDPVTVNFAGDISRDFTDSATADSLTRDLQTPGVITAITGARVTNDALDFNADNFAEGDGAYTASATSGVAHFKFANTVATFNPAFRISSWTYGTLPEAVILDNQVLTKGYHFNAYLNTGTSEAVIQFNKTLAPGTHVFFISHKTGLAVTLNRFEAKDGDGVDTLEWTTESEFENLGYHVWRRVAPAEAQVDLALADGEEVAGAGIANALRSAARTEAAKRAAAKMAQTAADTGLDTVPCLNLSLEEMRALGYERITPKLIPGAKGGSSASTRHYVWIDRSAAIGVAYEYLLEAVDFNGGKVQYGPRTARPQNPLATELGSNYPNPFNPVTTLRFSLKEKLKVSLLVYDAKGKLVRTLVRPDKYMNAGKYRMVWDAKNEGGFEVPSGQYFYRFTAGRYVKTRKMILVK